MEWFLAQAHLGKGDYLKAIELERSALSARSKDPEQVRAMYDALDEAFTSGKLVPGSRVMLVAFGGGLTWGACYFTWGR